MTTERLEWFRCFPSKWLKALAGLHPNVGYVYLVVCLRIYEANSPCPDSLQVLCRRTGYNKRIVSEALNTLFESGKLKRVEGGIANPFAETELADARHFYEVRKQSASVAANARWKKPQQNQTTDDA